MDIKLVNKNTVEIDFSDSFSWDKVERVKTIPGRKYDDKNKVWRIKINEKSFTDFLMFCQQFDFTPDGKLDDLLTRYKLIAIKREKEAKANKKLIEKKESDLKKVYGLRKGMKLRPFQKIGVEYVDKNRKVIIGDEMGLGKTVEAIASLEHMESYPALVVCPASLKDNWKKEVKKWVRRSVSVIDSQDKKPKFRRRIVIINYDILKKYYDELSNIEWEAIIFDESHYLKNEKAQRTKYATKLAKKVPVRILLSGTAVVNRPSELISQLKLLGVFEKHFGGWWPFVKRYCNAYKGHFGWDISGASNLKELHEKLTSVCYIRRNKEQVLTELPPKQRQILSLPITNRQEYQKAEDDVVNYLKNKAINNKEFLDSISHLSERNQKQAKRDKATKTIQKALGAEHLMKIHELRKLASNGKMSAVKQWIGDFLESGEKLVVFAHHKHIVKEIIDKFGGLKITGDVPTKKRQGIVDKFQNDPDEKLIVLNIQAGGVGITLTAASNIAFVETAWEPGSMAQAEDRCHRIGQKESVNIYYLLSKGTIDEDVYDLIVKKRVITDAVNKGKFQDTDDEGTVMKDLMKRLLKKKD